MRFDWKRYGGYEVSTRGDRRFSAFNATLSDGRSIEQHYQCDVKGHDPGGTNWRLGKGKPPVYDLTPDELWQSYLALWHEWSELNRPLMRQLYREAQRHGGILSDRFASSPVNQARALAECLNDLSGDERVGT